MRGKSSILFSLLILLISGSQAYSQKDSLQLSYQEYLENILLYHPVAKQADLKIKSAIAAKLKAKGLFDPELASNWTQKSYDDKLYYRQFQSYFTLPTRLGINLVGGYEYASGLYLNPENLTDNFGLWMAGIEIDLIQGLWINERQTALKQAEVIRDLAENQQLLQLNTLILKATEAYLDWQKYHAFSEVILESISIAEEYFSNTRVSYLQGEKTAMDTLEAKLSLQDALIIQQKNMAKLNKAIQTLENFVWFEDIPLKLHLKATPESIDNALFEPKEIMELSNLVDLHPIIQEKINKRSSYELDLRLKREKLKPKLKAKYHPLLAGNEQNYFPDTQTNGYRVGLDFTMPLLFRVARADIQQNKIKIQDIDLDILNKKNELLNLLENNLNQQVIIKDQIQLQETNVSGYNQLLFGEEQKFKFGESSVFLLNKRQEKYIQSKLKLIELKIELSTLELRYLYYSNTFIQ
jgi:outer membrane protein TolC